LTGFSFREQKLRVAYRILRALKAARSALLASALGYAVAIIIEVAGWIDAGLGMLTGIVFTIIMALSASACVITQLLWFFRQRKQSG
jgi:hypothetical protein